jgi:hypothetical protein
MRLSALSETMTKSTLSRIALVLFAACAAPQASAQTGVVKDSPPPPPRVVQQDPPPPKPPPSQPGQLDSGRYEGGRYVNDFFGLSLTPPKDWQVVAAPPKAALTEMTNTNIAPDDARKQVEINDSIQRTTTLLSLTKHPAGSPANAVFLFVAERVPSSVYATGTDVLRSIEAGFKGTQFKVEFQQGGIRTERIGGAEFAVATFKVNAPAGVFMQKTYVTVRKGYGLQFFLTYVVDEGSVATFDEAVRSVVIK